MTNLGDLPLNAPIPGGAVDSADGRLVQTVGEDTSSNGLTCTTSYQSVPGISISITPDVDCYALVMLSVLFYVEVAAGSAGKGYATIRVDSGAEMAPEAIVELNLITGGSGTEILVQTVTQTYLVPLTSGGTRVISMRAKKSGTGTVITSPSGVLNSTRLMYCLVAQ